MTKRKKSPFSLSEIGAMIPGKQRSEGKGISKMRVSWMLRHPDSGQNRARLTAALVEMGLTKEGAAKFINGYKTNEQ